MVKKKEEIPYDDACTIEFYTKTTNTARYV